MTREELKAHCIRQIEQIEMWAKYKGEKPSGKVYAEHKLILELLDQEQKADNEWCTDCKEYDHEKHCCPRFSQVIKNTVQEIHDNQWIPCSERLPLGSKIVLLKIPAHVDAEGEHYSQGIICGHYIGGIFDDWGISDGTTVGYGLVRTKYGVNPTAWMPLPSIYQPKDGEKE